MVTLKTGQCQPFLWSRQNKRQHIILHKGEKQMLRTLQWIPASLGVKAQVSAVVHRGPEDPSPQFLPSLWQPPTSLPPCSGVISATLGTCPVFTHLNGCSLGLQLSSPRNQHGFHAPGLLRDLPGFSHISPHQSEPPWPWNDGNSPKPLTPFLLLCSLTYKRCSISSYFWMEIYCFLKRASSQMICHLKCNSTFHIRARRG